MTNVLWIIDDDHPPYMMEPTPFTRKFIRDIGINFEEGHADVPCVDLPGSPC